MPLPSPSTRETNASATRSDSWPWFLACVLSQAYLVFTATLFAISVLPLAFGWHSYLIKSGSMEPLISAGDVVLASIYDTSDAVPVGGVVAFHMGGENTTVTVHRIVSVDEGSFTTAGDANAQVDTTPLQRQDIISVGRILVPWVGLPALWLMKGTVLPFALWALLTAFAVFTIVFARMPAGGGRRPPGNAPEADDQQHDTESRGGSEGAPTRKSLSRRSLLAGAILAGSIALTALPRRQAIAMFTGSTANLRSSWSVATLPPLTIGRAAPYALFAATSVINTAFLGIGTSVTGSVGTSPGSAVLDFWPWDISGSTDRNNSVAQNARADAQKLTEAIAARPTTGTLSPTLTGTVAPGVYASSSGAFTVNGTLVLDAAGDTSAVFIFRGTNVRAATNSRVQLVNGASAERVFWHADSGIMLDQGSESHGNYITNGDGAMGRNSRLIGRLISLRGAVSVTRANIALPG